MPYTYIVNDLNGEEIVRTLYKKNLKKANQKNLGLKKYSREKLKNYMLNGKDTMICLMAG